MTDTFLYYSADDLLDMAIPEREDVIEGVLAVGASAVLSGRPKGGKSWAVIDMSCSIATDTPFLDRAVKSGPVIYCPLEDSLRVVRDRVRLRTAGQRGVPLYIVPLDGSEDQSFQVERPEDGAKLAALIEEIRPVLVIIDTLRSAHSGKENDADDMQPRLRIFTELAHQYNVAILLTHHQNKNGTSRGSTSIAGAVDDVIEFTRIEEPNSDTIKVSMAGEGRNGRFHLTATFNPDTGRWEPCDAPPVVEVPGLRENILATLARSAEPMTAREIGEHFPGTKLKTIQNRLSKMMAEQPRPMGATQSPRGRVYFTLQPHMPGTQEPEPEPAYSYASNGAGDPDEVLF